MRKEHFLVINHYGVSFEEQNNRIELATRICDGIRPRTLLDVGCGDGGFLKIIRHKLPECQASGLEASEIAWTIAVKNGWNVHRQDVETGEWPFPASSFQMCFAGEIIEHVFSPDDVLAEIHRVLEPGGYLLLTTPNLAAWFNRVSLLLGYQPIHSEVSTHANYGHILPLPGTPAGHIRLFTWRALRDMLAANGFSVVRGYGVGQNAAKSRNRLVKSLAPLFNRLFSHVSLASGLVVLARKTPIPSTAGIPG